MPKFVEMPHGFAFDVDQVLWYQVLYGESFDPEKCAHEGYMQGKFDFTPMRLFIHFKNGDDLKIPDFERFLLERFYDAIFPDSVDATQIDSEPLTQSPLVFDATSNNGVYFVQGEITQRIKIGFSSQVDNRIKDLETSEPLRLLHVISDASTEKERSIHQQFAHLRVIGEWFEGTAELIEYIGTLRTEHNSKK